MDGKKGYITYGMALKPDVKIHTERISIFTEEEESTSVKNGIPAMKASKNGLSKQVMTKKHSSENAQ